MSDELPPAAAPSPGRSRGRGRGRGGRPSHPRMRRSSGAAASASAEPPAAAPDLTAVAATTDEESDSSESSCFICAEPISIFALPPCSHPTCHVCFVRLKALYKKSSCTFCNQDFGSKPVIFTSDQDKTYADFEAQLEAQPVHDEHGHPRLGLRGGKDDKLGVLFDEPESKSATISLLAFNCPDPVCKQVCNGWKDLKMHAKRAHDRSLCDYCTRNMKIFAHEHMLFSPAQLRVHIERGDVNLSSSNQKGFTGHPQCDFCRIRFYDDEQLFKHMREAHEQCFICVRNRARRDQYFLNYASLEQHFETAHFACSAQVCRDNKFVVFETAQELQQHEMQVHGEALSHTSKRAMKEARRLQVDISYTGGEDEQSRRDESEARARAREMFAARGEISEPAPSSTMARARQVPGLPPAGASRGGRAGFSGQLSEVRDAEAARREQGQKEAEQRARHAAVMQRVSHAVGGSDLKVSAFKTAVRTYRSGECSAEDFLGTLWSLFEKRLDIMEDIVAELGQVLDMPDKAKDLADSWETFHVTDSFPALTLASGSSAPAVAPAPRPRKAAVSSRGQRSTDIWSRVQQAAGGNSGRSVVGYPALPSAPKAAGVRATPWASASRPAPTPSTSGTSTPRSVPATASKGKGKTVVRASGPDFPSLPSSAQAAAKASAMRDMFNRPAPPSSAGWRSSNGPSPAITPPYEAQPEPYGAQKKKKQQGKKQLLFSLSASGI